MKTIIATFKNIDNDLAEYNLVKELEGLGCENLSIKSDTKELYENDENFRVLCKKVKDAKYNRDTYINKQKLKK